MLDITMLMAFSDYLILDAIRLLANDRPLTYAEIAKAVPTPCSVSTIKRSINRLEQSGHITRNGPGHKIGYRYEVLTPVPDGI
jgi:predicted transcriptional regulator